MQRFLAHRETAHSAVEAIVVQLVRVGRAGPGTVLVPVHAAQLPALQQLPQALVRQPVRCLRQHVDRGFVPFHGTGLVLAVQQVAALSHLLERPPGAAAVVEVQTLAVDPRAAAADVPGLRLRRGLQYGKQGPARPQHFGRRQVLRPARPVDRHCVPRSVQSSYGVPHDRRTVIVEQRLDGSGTGGGGGRREERREVVNGCGGGTGGVSARRDG